MKKNLLSIAGLLMVLFHVVFAQTTCKPPRLSVTAGTEINPAPAISIGIETGVAIAPINRVLTFKFQGTLPYFLADGKHWRMSFIGTIPVWKYRYWQLLDELNLSATSTQNVIFSGCGFSLRDALFFGYSNDRFTLFADCAYRKYLLSYIKHSAYYKRSIYPSAKDGWYDNTGGIWYLGMTGGVFFTRIAGTFISFSFLRTEQGNPISPMPQVPSIAAEIYLKFKIF